jgi:CelD/BcsL family acetyltransferase involved in cellulose biosynthesis
MIRIENLEGSAVLEGDADTWNAIVGRANLGPAHRTEWLLAAYSSGGHSDRLYVMRLWQDGTPVGYFAYLIRRESWHGVPVRHLVPLALLNQLHGTQFVIEPRCCDDAIRAIVNHVAHIGRQWDHWSFYSLEGEPQAIALEQSLASADMAWTSQTAVSSPYLSLPRSWRELEMTLQSRFRTTIRSRMRTIAERGAVSLRLYSTPDEVDAALRCVHDIEAESWKQLGGLPITDPRHWGFYQRFAHEAAKSGTLVIASLEFSGRPLAFDYAVLQDGTYYLLQTSYQQSAKDLYPGLVLRRLMIDNLLARGVREVDFGTGDTEWKAKWTSTIRSHRSYRIFGRSFRGRAMHLLERVRGQRDA